ncbi:uncharacterized protein BT62DRAFT_990124 [Guyanagaster necrorhizus]|uniref:Uncharacterized protein n=1 Tax=Guyanagaster necrorhizus TaxID=856835 RepID=A0A9P7W4E1_9AGAR|nr:uncharacterized protein BT62DRAFT_990124 [Guyanagaster necrorhizus MCA 3950]KAG7453211.1 hypothetical protein BT62DRAFT_990124 [Guyanagaster necrorhizus MCA 3950]
MAPTTSKKIIAATASSRSRVKTVNSTPSRSTNSTSIPLGKPSRPASFSHRSLEERIAVLEADPFVDMSRSTKYGVFCIRPGCDGQNVKLDKRASYQLSNWDKHCRRKHGNAVKRDPEKSQEGEVGPSSGDARPEKVGGMSFVATFSYSDDVLPIEKCKTTCAYGASEDYEDYDGAGASKRACDKSTPHRRRVATGPWQETREGRSQTPLAMRRLCVDDGLCYHGVSEWLLKSSPRQPIAWSADPKTQELQRKYMLKSTIVQPPPLPVTPKKTPSEKCGTVALNPRVALNPMTEFQEWDFKLHMTINCQTLYG